MVCFSERSSAFLGHVRHTTYGRQEVCESTVVV